MFAISFPVVQLLTWQCHSFLLLPYYHTYFSICTTTPFTHFVFFLFCSIAAC